MGSCKVGMAGNGSRGPVGITDGTLHSHRSFSFSTAEVSFTTVEVNVMDPDVDVDTEVMYACLPSLRAEMKVETEVKDGWA